jgi:hypothetical protein
VFVKAVIEKFKTIWSESTVAQSEGLPRRTVVKNGNPESQIRTSSRVMKSGLLITSLPIHRRWSSLTLHSCTESQSTGRGEDSYNRYLLNII